MIGFGIVGIVCLVISTLILLEVVNRFERVESENANVTHTVTTVLEKYEQILVHIEKRQSFLESAFMTSEQLRLTITQLQAYNHFRAPKTILAQIKTPSVPTAQGGE